MQCLTRVRFSVVSTLLALGLAASQPAQASPASPMIEWNPPSDPAAVHALVTTEVVERVLADPATEKVELTDAEAQALAQAAGVTLPRGESQASYGRPWVVLKAGIGLPNLVNAQIEIFVHRNWTVSLETGAGLLPSIHEAIIRWRPDATCWGCDGKNFFSIGFGAGPGAYFDVSKTGVLLTTSVDAMYIHRFAKHFGFSVGSSLDLGLVKEFYSDGGSFRTEPFVQIHLLQIGLVF